MKSVTKKMTLAGLGAVCALSLTLGVGMLARNNRVAIAEEDVNVPNATTYFYDNLVDSNNNEYTLAKKFYEVLDKLNKDGDFLDGVVDYALDDIVTSQQIANWVNGTNLEVPKAFSAARDAYFVDHPEVFYIDFRKITVSVGRSNGDYVAFINSGREANLYYDDGLNSTSAVSAAVAKFNARVDEIVAEMNEREAADTYTARDIYLAKEVNRYLAENITYDYVAYDNKDDPNYIAAANINTAYGGLVEGKAVCGGFSFAYKVIMDRLGIPCLNVKGYSNNQEKDENGNLTGTSVGHMWNYVWLENPTTETAQTFSTRSASDGNWYSVDVTWDNASSNKYRYAILTASKDADIHVNDGIISSSGYVLTYPELAVSSYGNTGKDGFDVTLTYTPYSNGDLDDFGHPLQKTTTTVSYNGKSAKALLEEDGLYLASRYSAYNEDGELFWTDWASVELLRQMYEKSWGVDISDWFSDNGKETSYLDNTSVYNTQFAIFDVKPDRATPNSNPDATLGFDPEKDSFYFYFFSNETLNQTKPVELSKAVQNETYGSYTPPPYIKSLDIPKQEISDSMRGKDGFVAESKAIVLSFTYNEPLELLNPAKPIGITFTSAHPNTQQYAKFYPIGKDESGNDILVDLSESVEGSGVFDTLKFKFAPSLMYEHDQESYFFNFTNIGSAKLVKIMKDGQPTDEYRVSHKAPNTASATFGRPVIACPAFFNYDGRLYIDCCAVPTLVSQTDLSAMDFKDENGNSTFNENERSQMMLVAERASDETVDEILDGIGNIDGSNVTKSDIKSSETYDISLRMCGKYSTISDGSYVKIALGFPEGYGPGNEGVTFKLFHRKHIEGDTYIIEEVPCVVTQFGIVATVTSFSPYMVAVVDADKATDKTIYASIEGKGGTLTKEDGKIRTIKEGESYTYTIKPNSGYKVYSITLNGNNVLDKVVNGKLKLDHADLDTNNQLVIQYIANAAADRIQQKLDDNVIDQAIEVGKSVVDLKGNVATNVSMPTYNVHPDNFVVINTDGGQNKTATIVIAIVCVVVVLAAATAVTVVVIRKKKQ